MESKIDKISLQCGYLLVYFTDQRVINRVLPILKHLSPFINEPFSLIAELNWSLVFILASIASIAVIIGIELLLLHVDQFLLQVLYVIL